MYSIICASFLQMLETALGHLLEGRQVVEANEDYSNDVDLDIKPKFWSQLQSLLKRMLAASLPSSSGRVAPVAQSSTSNREAGFRSFCPPPHERRGRERPWPVEAVAGSSPPPPLPRPGLLAAAAPANPGGGDAPWRRRQQALAASRPGSRSGAGRRRTAGGGARTSGWVGGADRRERDRVPPTFTIHPGL